MSRLYRPSIPVEIKCRVALRQLGEMFIDQVIEAYRARPQDAYIKSITGRVRPSLTRLLDDRLIKLADLLGCPVTKLRLDHNPALENRMKRTVPKISRVGGQRVIKHIAIYSPDANDPEHLIYRTLHAHHIKTHVRGDGAQFSDTALAKRERRRKKVKVKHQWPKGRKIRSKSRW